MKVALVHDHLAQDGGAEKVLKVLARIYPDAPIYTLLYEQKNADKYYKNKNVETSIIQKLPWGVKHYQWYMPFMPMAVEFFDLSKFDVVVSDSSSFAKGVITSTDTLHICYCHTPTRYLWSDTHQYINELRYNKFFKKIISLVLNYIRIWDRNAADRVDVYIANSKTVKKRIKKYYKREAKIIYPPVETDKFQINPNKNSEEKDKYFLIGCRLTPYKRVELAIKAFQKLGWKLKIFGDGVDLKRLKKITGESENIEFLGRVSDKELIKLYQNCEAFIHPQEEDFGITPVEAMASGRPVIAYKRGGATETIISDKTGVFFQEQTIESLIKALQRFESIKFNPQEIRDHAKNFSSQKFQDRIKTTIEEEYNKHINE